MPAEKGIRTAATVSQGLPHGRSPPMRTAPTRPRPPHAAAPTLSVVVAARNAREDLALCLQALARSSHPPLEVLVVDDASTDDTAAVAEAHGARVLRLDQRRGPAAARNLGATAARGDVLFFTDADVCVHEDTLAVAARAFAEEPALAAVIGSYDDRPASNAFLAQWKNLFHHWVHQTGQDEASTFWTGCGAVRRDVFLGLGGFNEGYARPSIEDIEFGFRLRNADQRIRLDKRMIATHTKRWRFWDLLRTDLLRRGAPWIALMLRDRRDPKDLNLSRESKLATVLTGLLVLAVLALAAAGRFTALAPLGATLAAASACAWLPRSTRLSLALLVAAPAATALWLPDAWALLPMALTAAVVATHRDLYAFMQARRGAAFACAVLPMHLLFQLCCGASVPLGVLTHLRDVRRARREGAGPAVRQLPPLSRHEVAATPRPAREGVA